MTPKGCITAATYQTTLANSGYSDTSSCSSRSGPSVCVCVSSSSRSGPSVCVCVCQVVVVGRVRIETGWKMPTNCPMGRGCPGHHIILPWTHHLSPCPKRHLDQFIRFCTAHGCANRDRHTTHADT